MHKNSIKIALITIIGLYSLTGGAQAYIGKTDAKFQLAPNFQENGTGIELRTITGSAQIYPLDYGLPMCWVWMNCWMPV